MLFWVSRVARMKRSLVRRFLVHIIPDSVFVYPVCAGYNLVEVFILIAHRMLRYSALILSVACLFIVNAWADGSNPTPFEKVAPYVALELPIIGIVALFLVLKYGDQEGHLRIHMVKILGLSFVAPIIIILTVYGRIPNEAIVGLLGSIVGYFFGAGSKKQ